MSHLLHAKDKLTSKSRELLLKLTMPDKPEHTVDKSTASAKSSENWLSLVQDQILDFSTQNLESQIIGKLYNLCKKASLEKGGKIDIYNEDAVAYA